MDALGLEFGPPSTQSVSSVQKAGFPSSSGTDELRMKRGRPLKELETNFNLIQF